MEGPHWSLNQNKQNKYPGSCCLRTKDFFETFQTLKMFYETRHGGIYIPRTWEADKENDEFGDSQMSKTNKQTHTMILPCFMGVLCLSVQ